MGHGLNQMLCSLSVISVTPASHYGLSTVCTQRQEGQLKEAALEHACMQAGAKAAKSCCAVEEAGDNPSYLAWACLYMSRSNGGRLYHVQLSSSGKGNGRLELVMGQRQHPACLHVSRCDNRSCGVFPSAWLRAFYI